MVERRSLETGRIPALRCVAAGAVLLEQAGMHGRLVVTGLTGLGNACHLAVDVAAGASCAGVLALQWVGCAGMVEIAHAVIAIMADLAPFSCLRLVGGGETGIRLHMAVDTG